MFWIKTFASRFHCGTGLYSTNEVRRNCLKHVDETLAKLQVLIPGQRASAGLEDLEQRAVEAIEAAKARSNIDPQELTDIDLSAVQAPPRVYEETALEKIERGHRELGNIKN